MKRREFIAVLGGAAGGWPLAAHAQQLAMPEVRLLCTRSEKDSGKIVAAFKTGLEEAGFTEGKNFSTQYRFAEGQLDRLPQMAADLASRPMDAHVALGRSTY